MDPDSSPANNDNPADATPPAVPDLPANPNDPATELTEEQEQEFVNQTLGIKGATPDATPPTPATPEEPTPPAVPEPPAPETPPAPEAPVTPEPPKPEEPKPTAELAAPQTDDLWIEVQDSEGKDVKLVYDPENPNGFLPANFTFKDDNQLFSILDAKNEMANLYKERVNEFDTKTAEQSEQENAVKSEADQKASWDAEIQDLITGGLLDEPKVKVGDAKFMEDPTVQKVDAVFKFMTEQNVARKEANQPLLRSFGTAFNLYNAQAEKVAAENKLKEENAATKARGALVGGTSAASSGGELPVYKRGSANNIWAVKIPE